MGLGTLGRSHVTGRYCCAGLCSVGGAVREEKVRMCMGGIAAQNLAQLPFPPLTSPDLLSHVEDDFQNADSVFCGRVHRYASCVE